MTFTDDVVYVQHFGLTGGSYRRQAGLRLFVERLDEVWEQAAGDLEVIDQADDLHVAHFTVRVHAGQSDIDTTLVGWALYRFDSSSRVCRIDSLNEQDAAAGCNPVRLAGGTWATSLRCESARR